MGRRQVLQRPDQRRQAAADDGVDLLGQAIAQALGDARDLPQQAGQRAAGSRRDQELRGQHAGADAAHRLRHREARDDQAFGQRTDLRLLARRRRGPVQALGRHAQQARGGLGAFQVATEPEEVVRDPARQLAGGAADRQRRGGGAGGAADLGIGVLGQHPDILGEAVQRQPPCRRVGLGQRAAEAAGHGAPARAVMEEEHPQRDGLRHQPAGSEAGCDGGLDGRAGDPPRGRRCQQPEQPRPPGSRQVGDRHGPRPPVLRGAEPPGARVGQHARPRRLLRQPERLRAREPQRLPQQARGEGGQEGGQRRGLREARAGGVDDAERAGPRGIEQPRHAAPGRAGVLLQRVERAAILPAQQHGHAAQAVQRLHVQDAVAHRQVAVLHQRAGQLARQHHVLEPQLVGRARASAARGLARRPRGPGAPGCPARPRRRAPGA
jgi:hypothetical protein